MEPAAGLFTNAAGTHSFICSGTPKRYSLDTSCITVQLTHVTVTGIGPDVTPNILFTGSISTGDGSAGSPYPAKRNSKWCSNNGCKKLNQLY